MTAEERRHLIMQIEKIRALSEIIKKEGVGGASAEEIHSALQEITERLLHISEEAVEIERQSPLVLARRRAPVLIATTLIELLVAFIIMPFEKTIAKYATIYAFAPLVSAICGNHGLQTAAITIRGLSVGTVKSGLKVVVREMLTGLIAGIIVGLVAGIIAFLSTGYWEAIMVLVAALSAGMFTSGIMGAVIPMVAHKLGFDPAIIAGPGETALQDCASYFTFLLILTLLID